MVHSSWKKFGNCAKVGKVQKAEEAAIGAPAKTP
jgi:hypothetical protein